MAKKGTRFVETVDGHLSKKILNLTGIFFNRFGGKLIQAKAMKIRSYSSLKEKVLCINFYIEFDSACLFSKGSFTKEVYPRYRKIRSEWYAFLRNNDIKLFESVVVGFVPILKARRLNNNLILKKAELTPLGSSIVKIGKTTPKYLCAIAKKFSAKFALMTPSGAYIGPEGGMLMTLQAIKNLKFKINSFIDLAAGTGELSAYMLKNFFLDSLVVNELSKSITLQIKTYLNSVIKITSYKPKITYNFLNCIDYNFLNHADLISLGVFYGAQPDFFKKNGFKISMSLGENGILLLQSSMPETLFNLHIIENDYKCLNKWPWFDKAFSLSNYFPFHRTLFVDNQFITLASRSRFAINSILNELVRKGAVPYSDLCWKII